jgi:co-chaperonin GroES (HSP10)
MNINDIKIEVFPGRLLIEREIIPQSFINPKGEQRRRNKGKVVKSTTEGYLVGDDIFFAARRGTLLGNNALIDINDVILHNMILKGDRVLVEPIDEFKTESDGTKKTDGGLIVPNTIQLAPQMGIVQAVGSDVREGEYAEGNKVLFRKEAGIVFQDKEHIGIILSTKDIYAIL